ncbi:sensor domain-containing diguanylate cyclase [Mangrovihabitans endophyticus]|uniref:PAS domain S-box-containing protein/diguanylate cyclase (GGDEF) domain-containing protein n=1 Tax=Mangrovihabitans endophyticus TaxID=1751298 RepID=A0A8J3FPB4_9ACTN|nr:sensor domain-containing diguanylate cyclase [Mangrovihabitans endophyticus]GGK98289.1 hypothetical protein GCM10012284_35640 [Mangrovihabitans endophyticus]
MHREFWNSWPLRLTAALAAVSVAVFGVNLAGGPVVPGPLVWLPVPLGAALGAMLAMRASAAPAARSFWRFTAAGMTGVTVSLTLRLIDTLIPGTTLDPVADALHGASALLLSWPLLRLPLGLRNRSERIALWLDVAVLTIAAAVFLWHFAGHRAVHPSTGGVASAAAIMAAGLAGVFLAAKAALSGRQAVPPRALYMNCVAATVGGLGSGIGILLSTRSGADSLEIVNPIASLAIALSARFQSVDRTRSADAAPRRRYSIVPYAAAGAVAVLLVWTSVRDSPDHTLVTAAAVVLIGLVVVRQLVAFRENAVLLDRIAAQEQRFRLLVQNAAEIVSITEPDGTMRYCSPAVATVLGRQPEEVVGTDVSRLVHVEDLPAFRAAVELVMQTPGASTTFQVRFAHADTSWRWLELTTSNLLHEPSIGGRVTNARDVTETRRIQARLSHEATHDALTGLANRALFARCVERSIGDPRPGHHLSVALVDLDDFKVVNDTRGHAAGDALLVAVAERMRRSVRSGDTVARLGGDEFAILFDGLAPEGVDRVLHRIVESLLVPVEVEDELLSVRASFGVADGQPGEDAAGLMHRADMAMYAAKRRDGGGFLRYAPDMAELGSPLRPAVDRGVPPSFTEGDSL